MRWNLFRLLALLALAGCATSDLAPGDGAGVPGPPMKATEGRTAPATATPPALIVTPAAGSIGRIASVNADKQYVVITCPLGTVPVAERRLAVYREGLKVGEIKITGPQRDTNTVGDIVAGECRVGDEVREH
jgi:hypothetical protein